MNTIFTITTEVKQMWEDCNYIETLIEDAVKYYGYAVLEYPKNHGAVLLTKGKFNLRVFQDETGFITGFNIYPI